MDIKFNENELYYKGIYWNDYKEVTEYINTIISGSKENDWVDYVKKKYNKKFKKCLIVNCGNGQVERNLIEKGLIESAVGVDISEKYLNDAIKNNKGLNIEYKILDTNKESFDGKFDLVVNVAALHHNSHICNVINNIHDCLEDDGLFINFEYIGEHRNQYSDKKWINFLNYNKKLPEKARQDIKTYPHLKTMLHYDPSEAIHSELILKYFKIFFDEEVYKPINGSMD